MSGASQLMRFMATFTTAGKLNLRPVPPEIASAAIVLVAGIFVLSFYNLASHSAHMAAHIALMNVVAPVVASAAVRRQAFRFDRAAGMWAAAVTQLALLWIWHVPAMHAWAMQSATAQVAMHGSLFASALCFWALVLSLSRVKRWQAIPALLLTGKLVCLLSALIIFSPRVLYDIPAAAHQHIAAAASLDDQQFAGLLMITACPLSYIIVGIFFAARFMFPVEGTLVLRRRAAVR